MTLAAGLALRHRVQQVHAQFQTVEFDSLRLVERPFVVRVRFEQNGIGVRAVRNDRDNAEQHRENRREHADFLAERIGAFDFVMNFKFSHKREFILSYLQPRHESRRP